MAAPPDQTADPALLAIDGAVATITLNRPASFNSIDLAIAKRLERIAAEVEAATEEPTAEAEQVSEATAEETPPVEG